MNHGMSFPASAGSSHVGADADDTRGTLQVPHTAGEAEDDGEHVRQRVLAVKLDFSGEEEERNWQRLKELSWQAVRYRNLFIRARWAEAAKLCVDPAKGIPHDVTKWIRHDEKMELSGHAYSAAEREVAGAWQRHAKRVLAGAPLPEWKQTAALAIRGHKNKAESGVRLSKDEQGHYIAHLGAQADKCEGGSWLTIRIASGTVRDWQAGMLDKMVSWEIPISKAIVIVKPGRHVAILRLAYALTIPLPAFGNRVATLGPIDRGQLSLRTECETRDFSGRLHTLLDRKEKWDLIRRRCLAQIGRSKGSARAKRKLLSRMTWENWLDTFLNQWSREIINWLHGQGIGTLRVVGLENADWPAFKFTTQLKNKGAEIGMTVNTEVDLAEPATSRAVKREIGRRRRKATKERKALVELIHQRA